MPRYFYCFLLLVIVLGISSCRPNLFPRAPFMIQPVPRFQKVEDLPNRPNFVQSYPNYKKDKTTSRFGPLVRIIELEYKIGDTIYFTPRMTSGFDEGEMTGEITLLLDQYELEYTSNDVQIREYVESVSYESEFPLDKTPQNHNSAKTDVIIGPHGNPASIVQTPIPINVYNARNRRQFQNVERSQLYNMAQIRLENEDIPLLLKSDNLSFIVHLQNTDISIYPTKEQFRILKRMIHKYHLKRKLIH